MISYQWVVQKVISSSTKIDQDIEPQDRSWQEHHQYYKEDKVVVDGNLITSRGPGTSFDFGLELVKLLMGEEKMKEIASSMLV